MQCNIFQIAWQVLETLAFFYWGEQKIEVALSGKCLRKQFLIILKEANLEAFSFSLTKNEIAVWIGISLKKEGRIR